MAVLILASRSLHALCPGSPTFTPSHYAFSGADPLPAFVRDLNGDGRGDLVVSFNSSAGFEVFLGSASGTLQPTPTQFTSDFFYSLAPGDVNGDGKVDVIANMGTEVRIYYGVGDGTFTLGPVLPVIGASPVDVLAGDFDHDGRVDVAVLTVDTSFMSHVAIFRQLPGGTFAAPINTSVPTFAQKIEAADLDRDGNLDILVVGTLDSQIYILYGNGDGTFAVPTSIDVGGAPFAADSVTVYDFNSDGRPDLAVGIVDVGVQILINTGARTFSPAQLLGATGGSVVVADFNYDGIADVFASGYGGFFIFPARADGTFGAGQFTPVPELGSGTTALRSRYLLGDLRGINRVDVATDKFYPTPQTLEVNLNNCGPPPIVTSILASSGPVAGGQSVQVTGSNFFAAQQVLFGTTPAAITAATPTQLTVTVPAHSPAVVSVSVATPEGIGTLASGYTFFGPSTTAVAVPSLIAARRLYTITATITPPPGGGTVRFLVDGVVIGTGSVAGATATIDTAAPPVLGAHSVVAQFSGVAIYTPSSGGAETTVVADLPLFSPGTLAALVLVLMMSGFMLIRQR